MSGTETHGFDLVIEFSEQAFNDLLFALLQAPLRTLCSVLPWTGDPADCDILAVDVLFDRPTDVTPAPPAGQDLIDVRVRVGPSGNIGSLRIVVGLDVVNSTSTDDLILNFESKTYHVSATGVVALIPGLRGRVEGWGRRTLVGPTVDRTGSNPRTLSEFDVRIIDDTTPADRDAAAFLFSFGGSTGGSRTAFTSSLVPAGGRGAIAIFFEWLCRMLDEALNNQFGDPTLFSDCRLQRPFVIDAENDVSLTSFAMTLEDGFIAVRAAVSKSGFCYTATGTMGARIQFAIEPTPPGSDVRGRLIASVTLEDPVVSIDVPWYCWLGLAFLGFVIGALGGVLTAIIGAILAPVLLSITTDTVENVINRVLSDLAARLNDLIPEVSADLPLVSMIFERVFIDDIKVEFDVRVEDHAPIKASGVLTIPNGAFADLDTGTVGGHDLSGADLALEGAWFDRRLRTVCEAGIARTGSRDFESFARHHLWRYTYASPESLALFELATIDPFGIFTGDMFDESRYVYALHTDDNRYAVFRVIEVADSHIKVQYKTYEKAVPSVSIVGGFSCTVPDGAKPIGAVAFTPGKASLAVPSATAAAAAASPASSPCSGAATALRKQVLPLVDRSAAAAGLAAQVPLGDRRIGTWSADFQGEVDEVGRFEAVANGLHGDLTYAWEVAGQPLPRREGRITVLGSSMRYTVDGSHLTLGWSRRTPAEFGIKVSVSSHDHCGASTKRCFDFHPTCKSTRRVTPPFAVYQSAYLAHYGVVEVELTEKPTVTVTGAAPPKGQVLLARGPPPKGKASRRAK
jgi:hypothetical protein